MRYADGPTVEVDILVAASIERVWALVSDIELLEADPSRPSFAKSPVR